MKKTSILYCLILGVLGLLVSTEGISAQELRSTKSEDLDFLRSNKKWIELDVEVNSWWTYEDTAGYFWFNSSEGLCKFDGNQFYHYKYKPNNLKSIPNGFITSFAFENKDHVWLGYRKLGLFLYDLKSEEILAHYDYTPEDPNSLSADGISSMVKDNNDDLWIMTDNSIFHQFDPKTSSFNKFELPVPKKFKEKNKDRAPGKIIKDLTDPNILWIGSKFGIYQFDIENQRFVLHEIDKYVESYGYQFSTPLYQTDDGLLWYGHFRNEGVKVYDPKQEKWLATMSVGNVSSSFIYDIKPYGDSLLIASVRGSHFMIMDKYDPGVYEVHSGTDIAGFSILNVDRNGNIYSTSPTGKLTKLNRYWSKFDLTDLRKSIGLDIVPWCILYDKEDNLLYVTRRNGSNVLVLDRSLEYVSEFTLLDGGESMEMVINGINMDTFSKQLYFATSKGIFTYNKERHVCAKEFQGTDFEYKNYSELILWRGEQWALGENYLLRKRKNKEVLEKITFPSLRNNSGKIKSLAFLDLDQLFISTTKGLLLYDLNQGSFIDYKTDQLDLSVIDCNTLIKTKDGIWMGTAYNGIYKIDRVDSFSFKVNVYYNHISSLTNWHQSISVMGNQIWSSTSSGFTVLDINREDFISFQKTDGVFRSYRKPNLYKGPDNSFFDPFHHGFYYFKPKEIIADNVKPYLLKLKVNGQARSHTEWSDSNKQLILSHNERDLSFTLGAQNYGVDNRNYYRYKLEGLNDEWVYLENTNTVNFTNLPIGEYNLEFDARSFHSFWNDEAANLNFRIKSHPLWTWYSKLIYLCIAMILGLIFFRFKVNERDKRQNLLTLQKEKAESELKALKAQMNPHFLFNTLNSINWYIIKNKPAEASKYLTKFSKLMRLILDNSKERWISLARELETLTLYTDLEKVRFEDEFDYEIKIASNVNEEKYLLPPLIFQPFIENAIWHGLVHKKGIGHISLDIFLENGHLHCIIEDNGIGRVAAERISSKTSKKSKSSGIEITRNRILGINEREVEALKIIDLKDEMGSALGTRIEIILPIKTSEVRSNIE